MSYDSDSDDDVPDELKLDYVDERTGDAPVRRSVYCGFFFITFDSSNLVKS